MEESKYFEGLRKLLNQDCSIKIFSCSLRFPVIIVERETEEKENSQVAYEEGGNILSLLMSVSNAIVDNTENTTDIMELPTMSLDSVVQNGRSLHFWKLSENQILSAICSDHFGRLTIKKGVITDSIASGLLELNNSFISLNDYDNPQFIDGDATKTTESDNIARVFSR
jgi:hypothetical protein